MAGDCNTAMTVQKSGIYVKLFSFVVYLSVIWRKLCTMKRSYNAAIKWLIEIWLEGVMKKALASGLLRNESYSVALNTLLTEKANVWNEKENRHQ